MSTTVEAPASSIRLDRWFTAQACAVTDCQRPLVFWFGMPHGMLSLCARHGEQLFFKGVIEPHLT